MKEGATLAFRNGRSTVFDKHMRLEIDRWGKISVEDITIEEVNMENDLSATEYETRTVMVSGGRRRGGRGRGRGRRRQ